MKVLPFRIPPSDENSFRVQIDHVSHFYDRFHHHPEIQITLIEKGFGTLMVGTSITSFNEGDLLMIGANVPHSLKNDKSFYQENNLKSKSISIFFDENIFGKTFFELPEFKKINSLLELAEQGIRIKGTAKELIVPYLKRIVNVNGMERILVLLEILHQLSLSSDLEMLSNIGFSKMLSSRESKKMENIFQYVLDHYQRPIKLEEIATSSNLSVSAFCRFFKLRTRKTFSRFVNEFRISVACKRLLDSDYSISEICYQVGFTNLSNFNRQFKNISGYTPSQYIALHS